MSTNEERILRKISIVLYVYSISSIDFFSSIHRSRFSIGHIWLSSVDNGDCDEHIESTIVWCIDSQFQKSGSEIIISPKE